MRQILTIFIMISTLKTALVTAQQLPEKVKEKPGKYALVSDEQNTSPTNNVFPYQIWYVYSTEENNPTYTTPEGSTQFRQLRFMEKLMVADEDGQWLHLVKDDNIDGITLSSSAVDYGWIHKDKLLLWEHCLVTEKGEVNRKAMILNTVNHLKNIHQGDKPDTVAFLRGPHPNSPETGLGSHLFEFFFVYKTYKEDNQIQAVLLGKEELIPTDESQLSHIIVGWAPHSRITYWDHRIAIEPNWEPKAVQERKKGRRAKFFLDRKWARKYQNGDNVSPSFILWGSDQLDKRPIGQWRRFPLLRKSTADPSFITAGVMGEVYASDGGKYDPNQIAQMQRKADLLLAKKRNVNVVFVVDGTTSMASYYAPVCEAIKQSMAMLSQSRNNYRFGAAVYRDWPEGRKRLLQISSISSASDVIRFLSGIDARDSLDLDTPEALFYGLKAALSGVGLDENQTNVLILVGDAGNHHRDDPSQVDMQEVVDLLAQKDCHFLAFQVHHNAHPAYDEFNSQIKSIIETAGLRKYREYAGLGDLVNQKIEQPFIQSSGQVHKLVHGAYGGWLLSVAQGGALNTEIFKSEIVNFMQALDRRNNKLINAILDIISGENVTDAVEDNDSDGNSLYSSPLAPGILAFLKKSGLNDKEISMAGKKKYQLYLEASGTLFVKGQEHPLFKNVLLLSRGELHNVWESVRKLSTAPSQNNRRLAMQNVWKQLLRQYLGDVREDKLEEMPMERVHKIVFELPGASSLLKGVRLKDLVDPNVVSNEMFMNYFKAVTSKDKPLVGIYNMELADYQYGFRSNEQPYYWISEDLLP